MANNMGALALAPPVGPQNQQFPAIPQLGAAASITTGAASVDISLPTDANGAAYKVYFITASVACWITFGTVAQTAVASAAGNILIPANFFDYIAVPTGATHVAAIQEGAAGKITFVGVAGF